MGIFNLKKKKDFIDLTEKYNKDTEEQNQLKKGFFDSSSEKQEQSPSTSENAFNFLGNLASFAKSDNSSEEQESSYNDSEKKRKFAQRIRDMTSKIEDLSNQIYHLQQRIELLERKLDVNRF
ncbi:MAG: hypothetical protein ACOC3Z_00085 [Nanoarchaeota archaeon]